MAALRAGMSDDDYSASENDSSPTRRGHAGESEVWGELTPAERRAVQTTQGMLQMVSQGMAGTGDLPGMLQQAGYDGGGVDQMMGLFNHAAEQTPELGDVAFNAALLRPDDVAELELSQDAADELKSLVPEGFDIMDVDEEALRTGVVRAVDPKTGKVMTIQLSTATMAAIALASPNPLIRAQAKSSLPPPSGLKFGARKPALRGLSKLAVVGEAEGGLGAVSPRSDASSAEGRPSTSHTEDNQRYAHYETKRVWKKVPSRKFGKMGKVQKRQFGGRPGDDDDEVDELGFSRADLAASAMGGGAWASERESKVLHDPSNTDGGFAYKPVILGDWVRFGTGSNPSSHRAEHELMVAAVQRKQSCES
jgi:hypothetical protein